MLLFSFWGHCPFKSSPFPCPNDFPPPLVWVFLELFIPVGCMPLAALRGRAAAEEELCETVTIHNPTAVAVVCTWTVNQKWQNMALAWMTSNKIHHLSSSAVERKGDHGLPFVFQRGAHHVPYLGTYCTCYPPLDLLQGVCTVHWDTALSLR